MFSRTIPKNSKHMMSLPKEKLPCTWDQFVSIVLKIKLIFVYNITKTNSRQYEIADFFLSQKTCHLPGPSHPPVHLSLTTLYISHHDHPLLQNVTESLRPAEGKQINQYKNVHFNSTWNTITPKRFPFDVSSQAVLAIH